MRIAVLGGTSFIGPDVLEELVRHGHDVIAIHRGVTEHVVSPEVRHLHCDRAELGSLRPELARFAPQVAIDMRAMTQDDAHGFVAAFTGVTRRAVVVSSSDVYRAYARMNRTDPGPPDPVPLGEDSPLRDQLFADRDAKTHDKAPDLARYDKLLVERVIRGQTEIAATVLRLGMIHGPRSYRHYPVVRRIVDGRRAVIVSSELRGWRVTFGFSRNVADAIVLAAERANGGETYNVGEALSHTFVELYEQLGRALGRPGVLVAIPDQDLPESLRAGVEFGQEFFLDTSRIRRDLGYAERVGWAEGLEAAAHWMRAHPPVPGEPMAALALDYVLEDRVLQRLSGGSLNGVATTTN